MRSPLTAILLQLAAHSRVVSTQGAVAVRSVPIAQAYDFLYDTDKPVPLAERAKFPTYAPILSYYTSPM